MNDKELQDIKDALAEQWLILITIQMQNEAIMRKLGLSYTDVLEPNRGKEEIPKPLQNPGYYLYSEKSNKNE